METMSIYDMLADVKQCFLDIGMSGETLIDKLIPVIGADSIYTKLVVDATHRRIIAALHG